MLGAGLEARGPMRAIPGIPAAKSFFRLTAALQIERAPRRCDFGNAIHCSVARFGAFQQGRKTAGFEEQLAPRHQVLKRHDAFVGSATMDETAMTQTLGPALHMICRCGVCRMTFRLA